MRTHLAKRIRSALASMALLPLLLVASSYAMAEIDDHLSASVEEFYDKLPVMVLIIDPESGDILFANALAESFYGYGAGVLATMNIHSINQLSDEAVQENMQQVVNRERTDWIYEHRLADGSIKSMNLRSYPMEFKDTLLLHSILREIKTDE